jgi:hypothetical protein
MEQMNEAKHTPGPWEFVPKLTASENHKGFFIRAQKATRDGKWALADVQPGDEDGRIGTANARLIAAAPDLLAALQVARGYVDDHQGRHSVADLEMVDAAIAKATGSAA